MKIHRFETGQILGAPLDRVFQFFADAGNLEAITPEFLRFRIVTPRPIPMHEGALIRYRLSLHGLPMEWITRIDEWRPGRSFVDRQLRGPYRLWVHRHTFEPHPHGTRVRDRVDYALPLDPLSRPAHPLFVRPQIERIFAHRRRVLADLFGEPRPGAIARAS
jgi:ligand-binding SRPBCC domain-containing protein